MKSALLILCVGCSTSHAPQPTTGLLVMNDNSAPRTPIDQASIFTVRGDGSEQTWLTGPGNQYPSWTPDGQIIFVSNRTGTRQIWIMDADGGSARQIGDISALAAVEITRVQMADTGLIAFQSSGDGIYLMDADGSGLRELVKYPAGGDAPSLARSGRWLTFTLPADVTPGHNEIFRINTDGTEREQLTFFGEYADYPDGNASSISPDEKTVAVFTGTESRPDDTPLTWAYRNIAVIGPHGGPRTFLTSCRPVMSAQELTSLTAADCLTSDNPSWSDDGRWIIYDRGSPNPDGAGTYVIDVDGEAGSRLAAGFAGGGSVPFRFP